MKIIAKGHKKEKGKTKGVCLPVDGRHKKQNGKEGKKSKHQEIILISAYGIKRLYNPVKSKFRRHIGIAFYEMHKLHIFGIVISYIQAACANSEQKQKNRYQGKIVQHLLSGYCI